MDTQRADDVVLAESAAWIARLQGRDRTAASDAAFREWLAADTAHARAFSRATDVWELIPGAARLATVTRPIVAAPFRVNRRVSVSLAACAAAAAVTAIFLLQTPTYKTRVGQQRTITLDDGTRVSLNTHSRIVVAYDAEERRVRLERGEGLFEVAKDAHRPFVVQSGDEEVRALGTTFLVRKEAATLAVTLLEGRVALTSKRTRPRLLAPGERVTVRADAVAALDRPRVESLTAWRRGEVMFDDASLYEAISEMNRYGDIQLVVEDPALAQLRVSGVFAAQDPQEFAYAMARLYRLNVYPGESRISLGR
jgi:transmembrane sensor